MADEWQNHIKFWRKKRNLSLEKLGAALEEPTSKGTMSQYESGARMPSLTRLYQIATALDCSAGDILDGPRETIPSEPVLSETFAVMLGALGVDPDEDARAQKLAARFPATLRRIEALLAAGASETEIARDAGALARAEGPPAS